MIPPSMMPAGYGMPPYQPEMARMPPVAAPPVIEEKKQPSGKRRNGEEGDESMSEESGNTLHISLLQSCNNNV